MTCLAESAAASIEVYVSAVSSPSRFWVQFVGPQVTQLDELVDHMTDYYGNKDNRAAHAVCTVVQGRADSLLIPIEYSLFPNVGSFKCYYPLFAVKDESLSH